MKGSIPRTFIDDLLAKTDIVELVNSRVKLKKQGEITKLAVHSITKRRLLYG